MSKGESESYHKFNFDCRQSESLIALLDELEFNGFEEHNQNKFSAYTDSRLVDSAFLAALENIKESFPFSYTHEVLKIENWNAKWEEDFEPVVVDDFCVVRADFHAPFGDKTYEIVITPQMSFGTGHHETTRGMIQMMRNMVFAGKKVLDFGCGTGILAILAAKMGARDILGVDIDDNAYENSIHNSKQNGVNTIQIKHGGLSETGSNYDIILANINRHVILEALPSLSDKLATGNALLLSGILYTDLPLLERHLEKASFKVVRAQQLEDWMCILTEKM
jgi:ribosomal protein L11 methyltransferase